MVILTDGQKVKNVRGTGPCTTRDGSWKQYWINRSGRRWPQYYRIKGCRNTASDGAHVKINNMPEYHILPMCHRCNTGKLNRRLTVKSNSKAVEVLHQNTSGPRNCSYQPRYR